MSEELKPCPFCGGEARIIAKPYEPKVFVGCDDDTCLGFSGLGWLYDSEKEATEAWNRRAERTCHVVTKEKRFSQTQTLMSKSCSACGYVFGDEEHRELPIPMVLGKVEIPNYCKNCGAKVVDE